MWSAPRQGDRLVQVYVNAELAAHSASPSEREAWLLVDAGKHTQIELLAVEPMMATSPQADCLAGATPAVQPVASFALSRSYALPTDAQLVVQVDSDGGEQRIAFFADDVPRGGFGSVFGEGGFGYDAATGPGLGVGDLGYGPLGIDGRALRWRDDAIADGVHVINLSLQDAAGQQAADDLALPVEITRLPDPPGNISLGPDLLLTWT